MALLLIWIDSGSLLLIFIAWTSVILLAVMVTLTWVVPNWLAMGPPVATIVLPLWVIVACWPRRRCDGQDRLARAEHEHGGRRDDRGGDDDG